MSINPDIPVPLYHQIAEQIRRDIATGEIAPGQQLAPLRLAAKEWGVHLHTVRHAYAELARQQLVETKAPLGTRVLPSATDETSPALLDEFLDCTLRVARERYCLSGEELAAMLATRSGTLASSKPLVHIVECNRTQCKDLGKQLEARWDVEARSWPLDSSEELPPGFIVATYFHFSEIRTRWPRRLGDFHFTSILPNPSLAGRLKKWDAHRGPLVVDLCEWDEPTAEAISADLSLILPDERFTIRIGVIDKARQPQISGEGGPVLFTPRVWDCLPDWAKGHPRSIKIPYVFEKRALDALGRDAGWSSASGSV